MSEPTTSQAKIDIEHSAGEAVRVIAKAAEEATKVVANAASEAMKVSKVSGDAKTTCDHDLIIKLDTKMDALKDDIADLKSGTSTKIENHEIRIKSLEDSKTRTIVMLGIGVFLLTAVFGMMVYHIQH